MAYDLHIENSCKTIEQWLLFVNNAQDLILSQSAEAKDPETGEIITISTPNAAKAENGLYFTPRSS